MKNCSKCGTEKALSEFAVYSGKPFSHCRQCQRAQSKSYRERFPEKIREQTRAYREKNPTYSRDHSRKWREENREKHLESGRRQYARKVATIPGWNRRKNIRKYGITAEHYDAMLSAQGGVCAACGGFNASGKPLFIDHNHTTGQVRGLLCGTCNSSIGLAKESAEILKKLASYLEKHETLATIGAL